MINLYRGNASEVYVIRIESRSGYLPLSGWVTFLTRPRENNGAGQVGPWLGKCSNSTFFHRRDVVEVPISFDVRWRCPPRAQDQSSGTLLLLSCYLASRPHACFRLIQSDVDEAGFKSRNIVLDICLRWRSMIFRHVQLHLRRNKGGAQGVPLSTSVSRVAKHSCRSRRFILGSACVGDNFA